MSRYLQNGEPESVIDETDAGPDTFDADRQVADGAGVPPGMIMGPAVPYGSEPMYGDATPTAAPAAPGLYGGQDMYAAAPPVPPPVPAPPVAQTPAPSDSYGALAERLKRRISGDDGLGGQPVMKAPNWLERVASVGIGGLAGWSNAAKRAAPINIPAVTESVLHPGYARKTEEFQSQIAPIEAQLNVAGQQQTAGFKAQQIANETALKASQARQAEAHGRYWLHRAQTEQLRYRINAKGQVIDALTGEVKNGPPTARDLYDEAKTVPGMSEDMAQYYALNNRNMAGYGSTLANPGSKTLLSATERAAYMAAGIDPENQPPVGDARWAKVHGFLKPATPVDPYVEERRRQLIDEANNKANEAPLQNKLRIEKSIMDQRNKEVDQYLRSVGPGLSESDVASTPNGFAAIQAINRRHAGALQNNQDAYVAIEKNRNVDTTGNEYKYDPNTLEAIPVTAPAQPQPPAAASPGRGASGAGRGAVPASAHSAQPTRGASPAAAPGRTEVIVTTPTGKTRVFPNQAAADAFAQEMGYGPVTKK